MGDLQRLESRYSEFYERLNDARECPSCARSLVEWIKCGEGYELECDALWSLSDDPKYDRLLDDYFSVELAGYEFPGTSLDLSARIAELTAS